MVNIFDMFIRRNINPLNIINSIPLYLSTHENVARQRQIFLLINNFHINDFIIHNSITYNSEIRFTPLCFQVLVFLLLHVTYLHFCLVSC